MHLDGPVRDDFCSFANPISHDLYDLTCEACPNTTIQGDQEKRDY